MTTTKTKPSKPYPTFPLSAHDNGQWYKTFRMNGKKEFFYFGKFADDPKGEEALRLYESQVSDIKAGRLPDAQAVPAEITVFDLGQRYLEKVKREIDAGDRAPRGLPDRTRDVGRICRVFGEHRKVADLTPDDFAVLKLDIATTQKARTLRNSIQNIRSIFNYAIKNELIDKVRFGTEFDPPPIKKIEKEKREKEVEIAEAFGLANGKKFHPREMIQAWLTYCEAVGDVWFKAVILFCLNCASGKRDLEKLRRSDINLGTGWLDYPRPKTGFARRAKLWPETVAAIRDLLELPGRDEVEADADLVFLCPARWYSKSPMGHAKKMRWTCRRWTRLVNDHRGDRFGTPNDARPKAWFNVEFSPVGMWFKKMTKRAGAEPPFSIYAFRHTFQTVAMNATKDKRAVDTVSGYVPPASDMSARNYQQFIADEHLVDVAEAVRVWLFPDAPPVETVADDPVETVADGSLEVFVAIV